jgi:hypothetical protein
MQSTFKQLATDLSTTYTFAMIPYETQKSLAWFVTRME